MRVFLIESDPKVSSFIKSGLEDNGYIVFVAYDSHMAEKLLFQKSFNIIILDAFIAGIGGIKLCEKIRNANITVPVLMITSSNAIEDRIEGFNCGADDYMVKPIHLGELDARIKALDRMRHRKGSSLLKISDLELDSVSKKVRRNNKEIKLTEKEFEIRSFY